MFSFFNTSEPALPDGLHFIPEGGVSSNQYALDLPSGRILIDAGHKPERVQARLGEKPVSLLLATHGHFDHIGEIAAWRKATEAPFAIHSGDKLYLTDMRYNGSMMFGSPRTFEEPDFYLEDGDLLQPDEENFFHVWHTPGHTPGGVCYLWVRREDSAELPPCTPLTEGKALPARGHLNPEAPDGRLQLVGKPLALFTGDTIIGTSIGRTDFPGSSGEAMEHSLVMLVQRLRRLPPDLPLLSGHGPILTVADVLTGNPWLAARAN